MRIVWTEKAGKQLDRIFTYIADDSVFYAYQTVDKIIERTESIDTHPYKGRTVPEYEREDIYRLIDETADTHEPIQITGKHSNAILVSEDDWRTIQETLYLTSIPGMADSIKEGLDTPWEGTDDELGW